MKIPPIAVAAIGVFLCLLAGGLIGWFVVKSTQDDITAAQTRVDAAAQDATPEAHQAAVKKVADAKVQVQKIQAQWAIKQAALMPAFDVSHRFQAWRQINYELTADLPLSLQKWFPQTGVSLLSNISFPAPPASPNDSYWLSGAPIIIPLGTVGVGGDFHKILSHILKWNDYKRLVLIDNVALQGNSPFMQGSYTATMIIFPQGEKAPDLPHADAGTTGAGGRGGGFPGGGFPGGPGGPGMMGGGKLGAMGGPGGLK